MTRFKKNMRYGGEVETEMVYKDGDFALSVLEKRIEDAENKEAELSKITMQFRCTKMAVMHRLELRKNIDLITKRIKYGISRK